MRRLILRAVTHACMQRTHAHNVRDACTQYVAQDVWTQQCIQNPCGVAACTMCKHAAVMSRHAFGSKACANLQTRGVLHSAACTDSCSTSAEGLHLICGNCHAFLNVPACYPAELVARVVRCKFMVHTCPAPAVHKLHVMVSSWHHKHMHLDRWEHTLTCTPNANPLHSCMHTWQWHKLLHTWVRGEELAALDHVLPGVSFTP